MYNWIESRLRRVEQALEDTRSALAKLTAKAAQADQDRMKKPTSNDGEEDGSRFVQITGPISGGVYPGVIVERSGGSWVSTGEAVEVLAL